MDSDLTLIWKMKQGSEDACEEFIRKYYADILKYCHFHCQDRNWAEDLTQEVFLRFFRALPGYQHRGKAKNFLYTIAANLCRDFAARKKELPLEEGELVPTEPMTGEDTRIMLAAAVGRLPGEFREVTLLHYYQGLKLQEVAAVLKISLPLTKYRLKRAKELLRKELEDGLE